MSRIKGAGHAAGLLAKARLAADRAACYRPDISTEELRWLLDVADTADTLLADWRRLQERA